MAGWMAWPVGPVPDDRRLALVRDPEGRDLPSPNARVGEGLATRRKLALPNVQGIVLHPSGLSKVLGELLLARTAHFPGAVEHERSRRGRSLIEGHDVFAHEGLLRV